MWSCEKYVEGLFNHILPPVYLPACTAHCTGLGGCVACPVFTPPSESQIPTVGNLPPTEVKEPRPSCDL